MWKGGSLVGGAQTGGGPQKLLTPLIQVMTLKCYIFLMLFREKDGEKQALTAGTKRGVVPLLTPFIRPDWGRVWVGRHISSSLREC